MEVSEITYLIFFGSITFILFATFIVLLIFRYYKRNNKYQSDLTLLKFEQQKALLQSQIEIQEQTLQQVSRELHDNLGISASLIKIHLTTLPLTNTELLPGKVEETKELVRQLLTDIKSLSIGLDGDRVVRIGLLKAIGTEVERIYKTGQFNITLTQDGTRFELDPGKSTILYRMVQEILNNAVKHSGAKNINVNVGTSDKSLILAISDDGCGFDWEAKKNSGGAGLFNLINRANLIQAALSFQSATGSGTTVTIQLPTT